MTEQDEREAYYEALRQEDNAREESDRAAAEEAGDILKCPICHADMPLIGCEKTTICPKCYREWKWQSNGDNRELMQVGINDSIYADR